MQYLMVVPVSFFRNAAGEIACESAFVEHLKLSRELFEPRFTSIRIAAPSMSAATYEANKHHLGHFKEDEERIFYTELHPTDISRVKFALFKWFSTFRKIRQAVKSADLVHSGLSYDILMPFEIYSLYTGWKKRRKTVFVIDIDNRKSADMRYETGQMSKKSYLVSKWVYNPLRNLQIRWAVRHVSLLMLKSQSLVNDFGQGASHVKNFYDVAFSPDYMIPPERLDEKCESFEAGDTPIECTFFGRLVPYKGIDYQIRAVHHARQQGAPARLHILGAGEQEAELKALTKELGAEEYVIFYGAVPFGPQFFEQLYNYHLLLAAPISQDTPRSVFDAMAAGIPILAFDTDYYKDLMETGAVDVVPWRSIEGMSNQITAYHKQRQTLTQKMRAGVAFAENNSQEAWMDRRLGWINDLFESD
jgi:glycosyltransferase involved in cell wall biosynthesis